MIKVAILGGSGFTGLELIRILLNHPEAEISAVTSRQFSGRYIYDVFPSLKGIIDIPFSDTDEMEGVGDIDLFFSALPHGVSQVIVDKLIKMGKRVIDLSADFRLNKVDDYNRWYGEHISPELLKEAVYGLPELYRKKIMKAQLVANPGCYPTGIVLALMPLLSEGLVDNDSIVIDSKSGVSGAGRRTSYETSFVVVNEGFRPYQIGVHRHLPEIEQELSLIAEKSLSVSFVPHLLPVNRGILNTIYATLKSDVSTGQLLDIYESVYKDDRFVRFTGKDNLPSISYVRGSNFCDIGLIVDRHVNRVVIVSAIDNLIKGASGQAIQNMNIMFGLPEDSGLSILPSPI